MWLRCWKFIFQWLIHHGEQATCWLWKLTLSIRTKIISFDSRFLISAKIVNFVMMWKLIFDFENFRFFLKAHLITALCFVSLATLIFISPISAFQKSRYALPKTGSWILWSSIIFFIAFQDFSLFKIYKARSLADG